MKALFALALSSALAVPVGAADSWRSANVTKVVNDVRIYRPHTAVRKARPGDLVNGRTSLQTGRRSRSELRFQDDTITRLGANSIFRFEQGSRDLTLEQGTLLLQVPKGAGGARINTPTVTAAVTGTTVMLEYFKDKWAKAIVLEGSLEVWTKADGGRKVTIRAGQMAVFRANDRAVPQPVRIDLGRLLRTSALADPHTFGLLPEQATERISDAVSQQESLKREGFLQPIVRERDTRPGPAESHDRRGRNVINDIAAQRRGPGWNNGLGPGNNNGLGPGNDNGLGPGNDNGLHIGRNGDAPPVGGRDDTGRKSGKEG